jgi:uncharacterized protein (TIRG00374 family)
MTENASSPHEPVHTGRSAQRAAWRRWSAKPGRRVGSWIKLAVALVLIAILVWFVDWRESLLLLRGLQLLPASCAFALLALGVILSTLKWQVLLAAHAVRLSLPRLLKYYWIGFFFSNFLPSNVGGDIARLTLMYKIADLTVIGASILMERLIGLWVLLFIAAICLLMRSQYFSQLGILLPMWLLVLSLGGALSLVLILAARVGTWSNARLKSARLAERIVLTMIKTANALAYYRGRTKAISIAVFVSVLFYGSMILAQYSIIASIGGYVPLVDVSFIAPLIALVSFIPISVNALGLAEGAFVLFYTQAGLSPEQALAAAVLRRVLMLGYSLIGGVIWLWEKPRLASVP